MTSTKQFSIFDILFFKHRTRFKRCDSIDSTVTVTLASATVNDPDLWSIDHIYRRSMIWQETQWTSSYDILQQTWFYLKWLAVIIIKRIDCVWKLFNTTCPLSHLLQSVKCNQIIVRFFFIPPRWRFILSYPFSIFVFFFKYEGLRPRSRHTIISTRHQVSGYNFFLIFLLPHLSRNITLTNQRVLKGL